MKGFSKVFGSLLFSWIFNVQPTQVDAYYNDVINPVKSDVEVWLQRRPRVAVRSNTSLGCEKPNFYICEEPPDIILPEATKKCNYRNQLYHEQVFRWVAGRGCLLYTPDFIYVGGANPIDLSAGCFYGNLFAPCVEISKDDGTCGCYPFDPGLDEVVQVVNNSLLPSVHGRWEECFYAASSCCTHYMHVDEDQDSNNTVSSNCQTTFDGWTCWHETKPDTLAQSVCSDFAYSGQGPSCNHFSTKKCHANGSWELQTDYSTCSITPRLLRRYRFYIAMMSFSIVACLPAVFIFFFYKRLRITRVALHRNLMIAIIVRNILVIVSRSEVYIDELTNSCETVMSNNGIACRILAVAERTAANVVFVCMLVEGIYLHRLIVAVFRKKLNITWLYGIGIVIAVVPVVAWALVMALAYDRANDVSCWVVYTTPNIQWILDAPRLAILLVNTALFCDVLRVLLTKIRNSENANQLNTAKATLFLMPIFGVQFLLTAFRPNTTNCTGEQVYFYVAYTVEGLQGFLVAMLYCYVNKEVHTLIKATYLKTERAVVSRVRGESVYPRLSIDPISDRRMTYSTAVPPNHEEPKDQYATVRPKLHVAEIISIQASEKLAEILEPIYETIDNGVVHEGYDSLERSDIDNDSGFIPNREKGFRDEYYGGFTNASSISIDCQDWIRCISSPSSSVYDNSLNDYETRYLERKFPHHPNAQRSESQTTSGTKGSSVIPPGINGRSQSLNVDKEPPIPKRDKNTTDQQNDSDHLSEYDEDFDNMLEEIMQYMEHNDSSPDTVILDPTQLSPNRNENDKIVFVENDVKKV